MLLRFTFAATLVLPVARAMALPANLPANLTTHRRLSDTCETHMRYAINGCDHRRGFEFQCMEVTSTAAIRCCQPSPTTAAGQCMNDGSICHGSASALGTRPLSSVSDAGNAYYSAAAAECALHGMRLCTATELLDDTCCNTGCGYNNRLVWSSTPCTHSYDASAPPAPPPTCPSPTPSPDPPASAAPTCVTTATPTDAANDVMSTNTAYKRHYDWRTYTKPAGASCTGAGCGGWGSATTSAGTVLYPFSFCKTMALDPDTGFCRQDDVDTLAAIKETAASDIASAQLACLPSAGLSSQGKLINPFVGRSDPLVGSLDRSAALAPPDFISSPTMLFEMAEVWGMAVFRDAPFSTWSAIDNDNDMRKFVNFLNEIEMGSTAPKASSCGSFVPQRQPDADFTATVGRRLGEDGRRLTHNTNHHCNQDYGGASHPCPSAAYPSCVGFVQGSRWGKCYSVCTATNTEIDVSTLFRGAGFGETRGALVSQYLLQDFSHGNLPITQKYKVENDAAASVTKAGWQAIQESGKAPPGSGTASPVTKYAYSMRVLGSMVHSDPLYQFYYHAAVMSIGKCGIKPTSDAAVDLWTDGGPPDVFSAVAYVARGALQQAWWNKWDVHMRIRPEVYAQRMHLCQKDDDSGATAEMCNSLGLRARLNDLNSDNGKRFKRIVTRRNDLVSAQKINCTDSGGVDPSDPPECTLTPEEKAALATTADKLGTDTTGAGSSLTPPGSGWLHAFSGSDGYNLLLPLMYPEGSPNHPSWPAGHAVVAGACVTVLKAMLPVLNKTADNQYEPKPWPHDDCQAVHSRDGDSLEPLYDSPSAAEGSGMTIVGELNKLASNVALGRNMAGVHFRSDGDQGLRIGEAYAITFLRDKLASVALRSLHNEYILHKFDGTVVRITAAGAESVTGTTTPS